MTAKKLEEKLASGQLNLAEHPNVIIRELTAIVVRLEKKINDMHSEQQNRDEWLRQKMVAWGVFEGAAEDE